jgi:hypothetical protein
LKKSQGFFEIGNRENHEVVPVRVLAQVVDTQVPLQREPRPQHEDSPVSLFDDQTLSADHFGAVVPPTHVFHVQFRSWSGQASDRAANKCLGELPRSRLGDRGIRVGRGPHGGIDSDPAFGDECSRRRPNSLPVLGSGGSVTNASVTRRCPRRREQPRAASSIPSNRLTELASERPTPWRRARQPPIPGLG